MMKTIIIEDEAAATRRLAKLISEIDANIEVITKLESIEQTINWLNTNEQPDLLFLDIHLADGSSFEIFNHVKITKPIIFTTAYDEYAIKAFKVNAIDYLMKPLKKVELEAAINKFKNQQTPSSKIDYNQLANALSKKSEEKRFLIKFGQQIKVVDIKDCAYFYTKDKVTFLVMHSGKRYPIDYPLDKLDEISNEKSFFRINRQTIINLNAIKEMHAYSKSRVKITLSPPSEIETIVSTERSPLFKKWLVGEG